MRTTNILTLILGIGLLTNCQQKKDDPEVLKKVLTDYFDGIKTLDIDKLNSQTTNDFTFFTQGKIWTNDSVVKRKDHYKTIKGEWKFDNIKANIDQSSGDLVYYNRGEFILNDTIKMKFDNLESATFRKVDGKWKLKFLHSTSRP